MKKTLILFIIFTLGLGAGSSAFAKDLITTPRALKKIYPKATNFTANQITLTEEQIALVEAGADIRFEGTHSRTVKSHIPFTKNQRLGMVYEDTVMGKWGPIHYLVAINPQGSIKQVIILDYQEIRGKPIAQKRYLKQYKGKNLKHPVKLRRDINGVSGATISSRSLTDGVRKLLNIHQIIQE